MNMFRLVVALLFLAYGLIIGVLNTQPITLKLLFTEFQTSSGVGIMLSLLLGVVACAWSPAALSHTVMTMSILGAPGSVNTSQLLLT